jgi:hypothetical protein
MTGPATEPRRWSAQRWRLAAWGTAVALLLAPLVAMQVTEAVDWSAGDFALAGALLGGAGLVPELAARRAWSGAYRAGSGVAVAGAVLLVWANGAVGLIGSEDHPANRLFTGVLAVGLLGAVLARLRPGGLARALAATAVAQVVVAGIALAVDWGVAEPVRWRDLLLATGLFGALWLLAAGLFRQATRGQGAAG